MREELRKMLSPARFSHSLGVADEARRLAGLFGEDEEKAYVAGLLHDCARERSPLELASFVPGFIDPVVFAIPGVLHAFACPKVLKNTFGITDFSILHAACWHATACKNATVFDKILFVADMSEKGRTFHGCSDIRDALEYGLDEAYRVTLGKKLSYLLLKKQVIYPASLEVWNMLNRHHNH